MWLALSRPADVETHTALFTSECTGEGLGSREALTIFIWTGCEASRASLCSQGRAEMRPGKMPAEALKRLDTNYIVLLVCKHTVLESLNVIILNYKPWACAHSSPTRQPLSACAVRSLPPLTGSSPLPATPVLPPVLCLHFSSLSSKEWHLFMFPSSDNSISSQILLFPPMSG